MKAIAFLPFLLLFGCCVAPPPDEGVPAGGAGGEVRINNRALSESEKADFESTYGQRPETGNYWYDGESGLWGYLGSETSGAILAGHDFGPLSPRASNGNTGVFVNGRELPEIEHDFLESLFGQMPQGRYWLDASGDIGVEGDRTPLANLQAALEEAEASAENDGGSAGGGGSGGGEYYYNSGDGSYGGMSGGCVWVSSSSGSMMSC